MKNLTQEINKVKEILENLKALNHHTIDEEMWRIDEALSIIHKYTEEER